MEETPKKTGKRGIGPLDAEMDFEEPTTKPGSVAANENVGTNGHEQTTEETPEQTPEELAAAAAAEEELDITGGTTHEEEAAAEEEEEPEQLELGGVAIDTPQVIRNGKMLCEFVRPHFERAEDGSRFVGFEFSSPLIEAHKDVLPPEVVREWDHMREGNVSYVKVESVEAQTIAIGIVPDDEVNDLLLISAIIQRPILAKIEEKGSGKKQRVIRFSFRAVVDQTDTIAQFAVEHHGDAVWISIRKPQGELFSAQ